MESELIGIIGAAILLVLLLMGVHIAIALAAVATVGLALITGVHGSLHYAARSFYSTASTYGFSVLPLFIVMGSLAAASGISGNAYELAYRWFSGVRAGLYLVTTGACAMFAAVTGSAAATTVAIGKVVLPEMEKLGYERRLSVACVAASGTLGVLIPPSIALVIYGIATEESIGRLLLAGMFPGILSAIIYMVGVSIVVRFKPALAPPTSVKYRWKERFQAIPGVWGIALLFAVIIGGIYTGFFTPTEAGGVGAFVTLGLLALKVRRRFFKGVVDSGWETVQSFVMIFFIIMAAIIFTHFLTLSGVIHAIVTFITEGGFNHLAVLGMILFTLLIMGMFMSGAAMIILMAPIAHAILIPLGYNGIWLGIIMVKMFELGAITPPVGIGAYVAKAIGPELRVEEIFKALTIFMVLDAITIAVLVAFPQISVWLPTMAFGQ